MAGNWFKAATVVIAGMMSQAALAADSGGVGQRWSVVGVIAGDPLPNQQPTGIAVLRNNVSQRSYTLTVGDPIPAELGFVLKNVLARTVVIAKGETEVTLSFAEPPVETTVETPSSDEPSPRVSKFLESYQHSFDSADHGGDDANFDDSNDAIMVIPRSRPGTIGPGGRIGILQGPLLNIDDYEEFD